MCGVSTTVALVASAVQDCVPGDVLEAGVWRGGTSFTMAKALERIIDFDATSARGAASARVVVLGDKGAAGAAKAGAKAATEKRRVAKLVQQLLAVEKAHQGAQARWRATQAELESRAVSAEAELARAREALERAEPIRRDLEEARRSRQTETARADAADARNAVLAADNDELRAETRSCQEKLLQALSLLEEYQEEMTDMSFRKRTGLPSRVDALSKPRTPPVSPSRR